MKKLQLKNLARKRHKILLAWAKDGCCNVLHYVAILDAELAILNKRDVKEVEELYQTAIVQAARGGWVQDAAVANERLAIYFEKRGDPVEAGRRYEQAIGYFDDWGFTQKSSRLREKAKPFLSSWMSTRQVASSSLSCK